MTIQSRLNALGLQFPTILLPREALDMQRWAVIACDQFTSDPEYWRAVEEYVGDAPSTLHIMLPEIYLEKRDQAKETARIRRTMERYIKEDVFREYPETAVFVKRTLPDGTERKGLVITVDLEAYDYVPKAQALVRASEETIPSRLPPRAAIRKEALIETPHVLVLYNDPEDTVVQALDDAGDTLERLYQTPLMMDGGSVEGRRVPADSAVTETLVGAFEALRKGTLLFATGDGNHSLAAAKTVWEERKASGAPMDDPSRYCLVELVNVFDPGLPFHPIHRLAVGEVTKMLQILQETTAGELREYSRDQFTRELRSRKLTAREIGFTAPERAGILTLADNTNLPVEAVDAALAVAPTEEIDYVHGFDEVCEAADRTGGVALIVPEFDRDQLFPTVAAQGTLPRKAFSLGEARDKRYYLECRALT